VSSPRVLLLGGTGYIGEAFARELAARGWEYRTLRRSEVDYTRFDRLLELLRASRWDFVVNCAGFTGKPNVDACESAKADTLLGNAILPVTVAHACRAAGVTWGHVSSGCIYSGAKLTENGQTRVEKDMTSPAAQALLAGNRAAIHGFTEADEPNFSFRREPCSFYSGTKALGEEALQGLEGYIWRLRIPFDEFDNARNYLSKVQRYSRVYDNVNSISHRADFARACLDLWDRRTPAGIYNVVNPGYVTTREVVTAIQRVLKPARAFEFWADDAEFYRIAAKTPRSNCILDTTKLLATGVKIRPVEEALETSLRHWQAEKAV
jgi:dTDP-4-dehydrorhamnose reductase